MSFSKADKETIQYITKLIKKEFPLLKTKVHNDVIVIFLNGNEINKEPIYPGIGNLDKRYLRSNVIKNIKRSLKFYKEEKRKRKKRRSAKRTRDLSIKRLQAAFEDIIQDFFEHVERTGKYGNYSTKLILCLTRRKLNIRLEIDRNRRNFDVIKIKTNLDDKVPRLRKVLENKLKNFRSNHIL